MRGDSIMANEPKSVRQRFSVPKKDEVVLRWIENQSNLSVSLRMLIRWAIQEYGYADVTCLSVRRGRGRPNGTAEEFVYEHPGEVYEAVPPVQPASAPAPTPSRSAVARPSIPTVSAPSPAPSSSSSMSKQTEPAPQSHPVEAAENPERELSPELAALLNL